jgi:transposase
VKNLETSLKVNVMNNNREHRHLSEIGVVKLVTLLQEGHSQQEVARRLGVSQSVVSRAWRRYRETGIYHRRQGQGRKRKTTYAEDRLLRISAKRKRFCTARELKNDLQLATGTTVSTDTIRRRLSQAELKPYRPATGPVLTAAHRRARLQFAHRHAEWQIDDWRHVLFTDESRFCLSTNDRRRRVWRRPGEGFVQCAIQEVERFGGGSVMVWGGITFEDRTNLVVVNRGSMTAVRYRDDIIAPVVKPFGAIHRPGFVFMHDNARPHIANVVRQELVAANINVLEWPPRSPDLNPIEHLWDNLDRKIRALENPPRTLHELSIRLQEVWTAIHQEEVAALIQSMPSRIADCIKARGGHTRY